MGLGAGSGSTEAKCDEGNTDEDDDDNGYEDNENVVSRECSWGEHGDWSWGASTDATISASFTSQRPIQLIFDRTNVFTSHYESF